MKKIYLQSLAVWLGLFGLAVFNAIIRESGYKPFVGELMAHQISTITGIALFAIGIYVFLRLTKAVYSEKDLWLIGFMWLGMTIVWEFVFGHFVMGNPWSKLFHDYNIIEGRVWTFVLLWTTIGPYIVGKYLVRGHSYGIISGNNLASEVPSN